MSLEILDVNTAVMTIARQGHADRFKRVVSHLAKFKWATISVKTEEHDLSSISTTLFSPAGKSKISVVTPPR